MMHHPALRRLLQANAEVPEHFRKVFWQEKLPLTSARVERNVQDLVLCVKSESWEEGKGAVTCT